MKIHVLGTGFANATKCYNTCFCIENKKEYFLVDGGGGNGILKQLKDANINILDIHNVFISHVHTDHILGVVWVVRVIAANVLVADNYKGNLNIYGNGECINAIKQIVGLILPQSKELFDKRIFFVTVQDGQTEKIANLDVTFLDMNAQYTQQFGFKIKNKLAFCGDEIIKQSTIEKIKNVQTILIEALCLHCDEEKYHANRRRHSTVKQSAISAKQVGAKNLVLWHSGDSNLSTRQKDFTAEAKKFFDGKIYVPNDLDIIEI